jgi:hypothetical protein
MTQIHKNAIVSIGSTSRYGVVTEVLHHVHESIARVHYIDPDTGDKMKCPDQRCNGLSLSCPIHERTARAADLSIWPSKDIAFYREDGMLSAQLADAAEAKTYTLRVHLWSYKVSCYVGGEEVSSRIIKQSDPLFPTAREQYTSPSSYPVDLDPADPQHKPLIELLAK